MHSRMDDFGSALLHRGINHDAAGGMGNSNSVSGFARYFVGQRSGQPAGRSEARCTLEGDRVMRLTDGNCAGQDFNRSGAEFLAGEQAGRGRRASMTTLGMLTIATSRSMRRVIPTS